MQLGYASTLDPPPRAPVLVALVVLAVVAIAAVVEDDEVSDAGELCSQRPRQRRLAEIVHALAACDEALEAVTVASCYLAKCPTSQVQGLRG